MKISLDFEMEVYGLMVIVLRNGYSNPCSDPE